MTELLLTEKVSPHILLFQIIFETEAALISESVNQKMSEFKQLKLKAEKKRHVRKKRDSFSDDEEINQEEFDKTRELQKLRKRPAGTNIVTLALGKKINKVQSRRNLDIF